MPCGQTPVHSTTFTECGRRSGLKVPLQHRAEGLQSTRQETIRNTPEGNRTKASKAADAAEPGGAGDGEHSPWVSRLLKELEHEVIVAQGAQRTFDRVKPEERRSTGCAHLGAAATHRSRVDAGPRIKLSPGSVTRLSHVEWMIRDKLAIHPLLTHLECA